MNSIFYLALLILAGFFAAKIFSILKLPDVTGYLLAGILIGPSVLGLIPHEALGQLTMLSEIALAFIAYNIGCEMDLRSIKKLGKSIITVTVVQALLTWVLVTLAMMVFGQNFAFSLVAGAIASATAPAATLLVIQQYNARGPLVDTLLPVVALDDAICIMAFGISSSMATTLLSGIAPSMQNMLLLPVWEIVLSLALGIVSGLIIVFISKYFTNENDVRILILGIIIALCYLSLYLHVSSLLTIMTFGLLVGNFSQRKRTAKDALSGIAPPVYVAFFCLSGAELDLKILMSAGVLGIVFILARALGKYFGAYFGAKSMKMDPNIVRYLGFTLLPQAGVAIGLSQNAARVLPEPYGTTIRVIVLAAVIANEISGPILARYALKKAGEIPESNL